MSNLLPHEDATANILRSVEDKDVRGLLAEKFAEYFLAVDADFDEKGFLEECEPQA